MAYYKKIIFILFFIAVFSYTSGYSFSDEFTSRRITAGARIFRALLASDADIADKTGNDGNIHICLVYMDSPANAERVGNIFQHREDRSIRKIDSSIKFLPLSEVLENDNDDYAGIFLTQALDDNKLRKLINYAGRKHILVFSPFEGDVERGIQSGLSVEAQVKPYINVKALRSAGIQLKSFVLRASKKYEN